MTEKVYRSSKQVIIQIGLHKKSQQQTPNINLIEIIHATGSILLLPVDTHLR